MSKTSRAAELAPSVATVVIGGQEHTVHPFGNGSIPYVLLGPRGGIVEGIRNIHSGRIHLMRGNKTLRNYMLDTGGAFRIVETC